jgi:hypothetical protein
MGSFAVEAVGPVTEIKAPVAERVRGRILDLKGEVEKLYVELAELLYQVVHSTLNGDPLWRAWGYNTFEDYAQYELGMKRAKAYYFMQIWKELHIKAGISKERLAEVDWSAAKELAPLAKTGILTEENSEEWLDKAKQTPVHQLAEEARAAKAGGGNTKVEVEKVYRVTYGLYEPQYENLMRALDVAKGLAQSDKSGHLLDLICTEFLAQYGTKHPNRKRAIQRYAKMLERTYGVKLIIVDDNDSIVHGKKLAAQLEA